MSNCFVCGEELKSTSPPVELWYRPDDSAHTECVWTAAKLAVYGFNASIVTEEINNEETEQGSKEESS